ncbi:hypothetical protein ACHAWC_011427 [Mediolabrus comicus]
MSNSNGNDNGHGSRGGAAYNRYSVNNNDGGRGRNINHNNRSNNHLHQQHLQHQHRIPDSSIQRQPVTFQQTEHHQHHHQQQQWQTLQQQQMQQQQQRQQQQQQSFNQQQYYPPPPMMSFNNNRLSSGSGSSTMSSISPYTSSSSRSNATSSSRQSSQAVASMPQPSQRQECSYYNTSGPGCQLPGVHGNYDVCPCGSKFHHCCDTAFQGFAAESNGYSITEDHPLEDRNKRCYDCRVDAISKILEALERVRHQDTQQQEGKMAEEDDVVPSSENGNEQICDCEEYWTGVGENKPQVLFAMSIGLSKSEEDSEDLFEYATGKLNGTKLPKNKWKPNGPTIISERRRRLRNAAPKEKKFREADTVPIHIQALKDSPITGDDDVQYVRTQVMLLVDNLVSNSTTTSRRRGTVPIRGLAPRLRLIHAILHHKAELIISFNVLSRQELDGRNNPETRQENVWELSAATYNSPTFNPMSDTLPDLHPDFATSIDLSYRAVVAPTRPVDGEWMQKNFNSLKNGRLKLVNGATQSGMGDGHVDEDEDDDVFNVDDNEGTGLGPDDSLSNRATALGLGSDVLYFDSKVKQHDIVNICSQQLTEGNRLDGGRPPILSSQNIRHRSRGGRGNEDARGRGGRGGRGVRGGTHNSSALINELRRENKNSQKMANMLSGEIADATVVELKKLMKELQETKFTLEMKLIDEEDNESPNVRKVKMLKDRLAEMENEMSELEQQVAKKKRQRRQYTIVPSDEEDEGEDIDAEQYQAYRDSARSSRSSISTAPTTNRTTTGSAPTASTSGGTTRQQQQQQQQTTTNRSSAAATTDTADTSGLSTQQQRES